jgi:hypothetical protein
MLKVVDDLVCQLFHSKWAQVVSYSSQGAWRCTKPGCAAQARHDRMRDRRAVTRAETTGASRKEEERTTAQRLH